MALKFLARWFGGPSHHEQRLLRQCRGDRELAERLIAAETRRRPGLSRADASARAVDRWQHER